MSRVQRLSDYLASIERMKETDPLLHLAKAGLSPVRLPGRNACMTFPNEQLGTVVARLKEAGFARYDGFSGGFPLYTDAIEGTDLFRDGTGFSVGVLRPKQTIKAHVQVYGSKPDARSYMIHETVGRGWTSLAEVTIEAGLQTIGRQTTPEDIAEFQRLFRTYSADMLDEANAAHGFDVAELIALAPEDFAGGWRFTESVLGLAAKLQEANMNLFFDAEKNRGWPDGVAINGEFGFPPAFMRR